MRRDWRLEAVSTIGNYERMNGELTTVCSGGLVRDEGAEVDAVGYEGGDEEV